MPKAFPVVVCVCVCVFPPVGLRVFVFQKELKPSSGNELLSLYSLGKSYLFYITKKLNKYSYYLLSIY